MHEDVRARLREKLQQLQVDAYLAYTPENLLYTTGFFSPLVSVSWRLMGTDMALIPADPAKAPALIVSDLAAGPARAASSLEDVRTYTIWIENRDVKVIRGEDDRPGGCGGRLARPAQYDSAELHQQVHDLLGDRGLLNARIGTDLRHMRYETVTWLQRTNPGCTLVDVTDILYELRMVKYPSEIERLRRAARLFEAGVGGAVRDAREGLTTRDVKYAYFEGVLEGVARESMPEEYQGAFALVTVGRAAGASFGGASTLSNGDLIKFDCGAVLDGYHSDCGRTFVFGKATPLQRRMYDALLGAHTRMRELIGPGIRVSELHRVAAEHMHESGFPNYSRGHFGHSVGIDSFVEEPPYVAADEHRELEPGMVLCIETPYYAQSLGSFQIEDMVLITPTGHENLNTLSYDLIEL